MKRLAAVAVLLGAFAVLAFGYRVSSETQNRLTNVPTDGGQGLSLSNLDGYQVTAVAPSGYIFSAGSLKCYSYNAQTHNWAPCASGFDLTLGTGYNQWTSPNIRVSVGAGRVFYGADAISVTFSDGGVLLPDAGAMPDGGLTVYLEGREH